MDCSGRPIPASQVLLLLGAIVLAGCDSGPSAPALRNDPVFQSDREGIRFLAPDDWRQSRRGEFPSGKSDKERTLVEYQRPGSGFVGSLRVSMIDLPESADLLTYLSAPSLSVEKWSPVGKAEQVSVGTASGVRYSFTGKTGRPGGPSGIDLAREVVAVRRNERTYFFTALFGPKDTEVREQLRRIIASVTWK